MKKLLLSVLLASISVNPVFGDHHKKQDVRPATKEDFIRFMKSSQGMWRAEVLSVISDNATLSLYGPLRVRRSATLDSLSGLDVNRLSE